MVVGVLLEPLWVLQLRVCVCGNTTINMGVRTAFDFVLYLMSCFVAFGH